MLDKITECLDRIIGSEDFWLLVITGMVISCVAYLYR
jgi:hypothetical protein